MPASPRPQRQPTTDWQQLRLLVTSPEQQTDELLRPIVLFGQPAGARARETGVPARTLRRKAARFDVHGMRSLFELSATPETDRRRLPVAIRRAIAELKAECLALRPHEIATICRERFDRPVGRHAVERVLASGPRGYPAADPPAAAVPLAGDARPQCEWSSAFRGGRPAALGDPLRLAAAVPAVAGGS